MTDLNLNMDDISSEYREIAELISVEALLRLSERYGGYQLYIPKKDSLCRNARDEEIRAQFTGYNFETLASRYNLSPRHIRLIVAPVLREMRAKPIDGQVSLFATNEE